MGFRTLNIKDAYDSNEDDILNDFYIPVLSEAVKYKRLAGYFSSSALAAAAKGIQSFLQRNGEMQLLVSASLSKADVEAITSGLRTPEIVLEESTVKQLSEVTEDFILDHIRALAWMVANKRLEIKIVIPMENGVPLDKTTAEERGIFHEKVGILYDTQDDELSFSGSLNETASAWLLNIEEFKVFKAWQPGLEAHFRSDVQKFEKYWNGFASNALVLDVPAALEKDLIRIAPSSIGDIDLTKYYRRGTNMVSYEQIQLRSYQKEAIYAWKQNDYKGIIAFATGTGKTLTALMAIKDLVAANVLVVVAVPTEALLRQWESDIKRTFPLSLVIVCSASNPRWPQDLETITDYISTAGSDSKRAFALVTYQTGGSSQFGKTIDRLDGSKLSLIADEVHHVGAPYFSNLLNHNFHYRLGLSATPDRDWDEEGQDKILNFFNKTVAVYAIADALRDKVLCEYDYHIIPVVLSDDERLDYDDISSRISRKVSIITSKFPQLRGQPFPKMMAQLGRLDSEQLSSLQKLIYTRTNIIKKASAKIEALSTIISNEEIGRCLIYCNDIEHLKDVVQVFDKENINILAYYSEMTEEQRQRSKESFESGNIKFLAAIKCLDEGINIPVCDSAILVASSKNNREFVQRRGRILRKHEGKSISRIFDILVLPIDPNNSNRGISKIEYEILTNELARAKEFATSARNNREILLDISRIEAQVAAHINY